MEEDESGNVRESERVGREGRWGTQRERERRES